jgi:uncharacterized protein YdaU (DUF1376 family)
MKYPWMPLFWGDFLANTMHLSAQEAGAYLFLIAHAWEHDGVIPGEKVRLARIAHIRQDQWNRVWFALEKFFEPTSVVPLIDGYTHRRVTDELHRLGKIANKRKAAAVQMHSKSYADASASTSKTNRESSLNGKQDAAREHSLNFRDKGVDYRAPPAKKSDNVLTPLPEKPRKV